MYTSRSATDLAAQSLLTIGLSGEVEDGAGRADRFGAIAVAARRHLQFVAGLRFQLLQTAANGRHLAVVGRLLPLAQHKKDTKC